MTDARFVSGQTPPAGPSDPMAPSDVEFLPISMSLIPVRVISALIGFAPFFIGALFLVLKVS